MTEYFPAKRFFFSQDQSSHWYLIPLDKFAEWEAFRNLDEEYERAWDAPKWAQRIDGAPCHVTFTDPRPMISSGQIEILRTIADGTSAERTIVHWDKARHL